MNTSWIKGIGLFLLLAMAVRVSITPGVRHRHEHGAHPHHHAHGSHSHAHEPANDEPRTETPSRTTHVHIFVFGWEFTFNLSYPADEAASPPEDIAAESTAHRPEMTSSAWDPVVTTPLSWGTLLQWVFDLKSLTAPAGLALSAGLCSAAFCVNDEGQPSRDRDKPMLPPPEVAKAGQAAS